MSMSTESSPEAWHESPEVPQGRAQSAQHPRREGGKEGEGEGGGEGGLTGEQRRALERLWEEVSAIEEVEIVGD